MKKKIEVQTIAVLVCVLAIAGAWIGIQVAKDSLGLWSESDEIHFETGDLFGLGQRSELKCSGATVGHIRRVVPSIGPDGQARFLLVAGVRRDYAAWKFAPLGTVKAGVVDMALAPSSIRLVLSGGADAVQAVNPGKGKPPVLPLEKEKSQNELADVAAQYRQLGDTIAATIRQFTEPQQGRDKSVMQELAESIPAAAQALQNVEDITLTIETDLGDQGRLRATLDALNGNLAQLDLLTKEATVTMGSVNQKVGTSLRKVNVLLDETTETMTTTQDKIERLGDTFFGRMLIAKPPREEGN